MDCSGLRSFWKHQKSIPDNFLQRNYTSIFFSTFFFIEKNTFWKVGNIFGEIFQKSFRKKHFSFVKFYKGQIFFPKWFLKIFEKNIYDVLKFIFFDEKSKLRKKLDHSFYVKNCQESISDVSRTIWDRYNLFWALLLFFPQYETERIPT